MAGLKVKCDCFAYMKYEKSCHALRELYCMDAECPFYKTAKQRCGECRELRKKGRINISCVECIERGIKKQEI